MVAQIAPLSFQVLQGRHDAEHLLDGVDTGAVAKSAGVDAHVAVAGVTLAALDLDPEVDQTALDRHDGEIGWLGDEHGIDRRQATEEMASALADDFLVSHDMGPEIAGQGNA